MTRAGGRGDAAVTVTTVVVAFALAFVLDPLVGEPPTAAHPVAWFGKLVGALDREWTDSPTGQRLVGVGIALFAPLVPAAVAAGVVLGAGRFHPLAGAAVAGLVLFTATSLRSLLELTGEVLAATEGGAEAEGDLETARERVRGLVGRDTSALSPAELRSAAVESAAENLSDGLIATLLPFAVLAPLSLPAAAAAAAWVKGVNTLDSMLGYPSKPIGTASARLDDLVMWVPARVTAAAIAVAGADPLAVARARADARRPASPNSGWPMATLAHVLEVRLRKRDAYDLHAEADLPTLEDGRRAVALVRRAALVAVLVAVALAVAVGVALAAGLEPGAALPEVGRP
ncbi:adenosylcobinamide-phosphate synthase [Halobiforma haloterrestris]|uniref:Probable cobalamin biosynthesis protein CobD n=1 Tax=Natronobacterium haloterrestre TaxID=148448 RepID=A0A1I1EL84_NATHA|nr:adenosylcobinamide-phosphate synthase CbiB [Halobiforma haloterrestris]SFB87392.1 adenosylcobinamide-phosphate synthase [Halobiforma haloterrestris]